MLQNPYLVIFKHKNDLTHLSKFKNLIRLTYFDHSPACKFPGTIQEMSNMDYGARSSWCGYLDNSQL